MKFYLAPMEGITGYIFRNAVNAGFGQGIDTYFTPFIEPHLQKKNLKHRELQDILPENNAGIRLVPQILTNSAEAFLYLEEELLPYGYRELNLNLGCPSPTVTAKGRGAGLLQHPDELDRMLDGIFSKTRCAVSVKTRIGFSDPAEWPALLDIFSSYPLKEMIIHVRVRNEFYSGTPHHDAFTYALKNCPHPLCYNGDITDTAGYLELMRYFAENADGRLPDAVMIGRGMLTDPTLIRRLSALTAAESECRDGGISLRSGSISREPNARLTKEEIRLFTDALFDGYCKVLSGETPVLHKMKEFWNWLIRNFPDHEKLLKKIVKAKNFHEYRAAVDTILK